MPDVTLHIETMGIEGYLPVANGCRNISLPFWTLQNQQLLLLEHYISKISKGNPNYSTHTYSKDSIIRSNITGSSCIKGNTSKRFPQYVFLYIFV
eukprot:UN26682